MVKYYRPKNQTYKKKRRSSSGRFFFVVWRLFGRFFKILFRIIKGKKTNLELLKLSAIIGFCGLFFLGLIGSLIIGYISRDLPNPNKLIDRQVAQSTKIYDRTGETLLYEIAGDKKRTIVKLDQLPDYVTRAVIALEDKTFYEHSGFRYRRVIKAVLYKLIGLRGPGASTLTSQLIKNAILSPERTMLRKLKEFILTYQIERNFSKDEILQLYLNEIPYGSTAYGIEAASNYYFNKHAAELTLAQAATLAAIIQKPTYFSPYGSNVEELMKRKTLALNLMTEQGYINEDQRDQAKQEELVFQEPREDITAPHFVFYVREKLVERYGEHLVNQGGLNVITTLDLDKQTLAEKIITERAKDNFEKYQASNAALVSIDPKTGEILAMVGSVDYFNDEIDGQVNVVTRPRQPGSSFKPIVYTLAWQYNYTPSTMLFDVETTFPATEKPYRPKNYNLKEHGPVSLRTALQGSLNIPAVKMLYLVGVENVLNFAEDLGYSTFTDRSRFGLSLVLGGGEVTLLDHTAAYATFANEGVYHKPMAILEVKTSAGQTLDTFKPQEKRVLAQNIARITSNVLSDNNARTPFFGAINSLTLPGRQAAAKTGTTNDYRDAWTVGYTPSLVTGVWAGNNDFSEMKRGADGSVIAGPIWQNYMRQALQDTPVESFTPPRIETPEKSILSGNGFGVQKVTIDKASEKLATEFTPTSFREERLFIQAHSILHYIDKKNPTGPMPNPPTDPQYQAWEEAVQTWVKKRIETNEPIFKMDDKQLFPENTKVINGPPPTENDDIHVAENKPQIKIISPLSEDVLNRRAITVQAETTAPRGIGRVEYYLDDILIGTVSNPPYDLTASLKAFRNGFYTLKAIAYDDIDNSQSTTQQIQLQSDDSYVSVNWVQPKNEAEYLLSDSPIVLQFSLETTETINQITFFSKDDKDREETVEALMNPQSGTLEVLWIPKNIATYHLFAKISVANAGVFTSQSLTVFIDQPTDKTMDENTQP